MVPETTTTRNPHDCKLYTVEFFGTVINVTLTSSAFIARKWLKNILFFGRRYVARGRLVVGVGVQWTPRNGLHPPADTLQLFVGSRFLIFQLSLANTVPLILRRFLLNPNITFVGIWNTLDEQKLRLTKHELRVHRLLDLRRYVLTDAGESLIGTSLEGIVKECLGYEGVKLERDISRSDWGDKDLSNEQVLQACVASYVSFAIGKNKQAWEL